MLDILGIVGSEITDYLMQQLQDDFSNSRMDGTVLRKVVDQGNMVLWYPKRYASTCMHHNQLGVILKDDNDELVKMLLFSDLM